MRSMPAQMKADFETYQRLAAYEDRFADNADAACAARYRADAYALLARLPLAAVTGVAIQ